MSPALLVTHETSEAEEPRLQQAEDVMLMLLGSAWIRDEEAYPYVCVAGERRRRPQRLSKERVIASQVAFTRWQEAAWTPWDRVLDELRAVVETVLSSTSKTARQVLGPEGWSVASQAIAIIKKTCSNKGLPLERVELRVVTDPEIADWQTVFLVLKIRGDYQEAEEALQALYPTLQQFADELQGEQRSIFISKIFFRAEPM